ncbi:MAG: PilZ domain-containing protein, partial [Bdellovibrionaceae bacterium]|nr:PilZ domain-containing protein [Pseudobdellovibrionaceae bacterium]
MSQDTAGKIYPRSPRYVLQMKDKKVLRYAPYPRGNRAFFTEIVNLSESGMAFTVPYLDCPHKNEIIMVEFTPPGDTKSIACYAQVKRIQKMSIIESDFFQKNCKVIAVTFTSL